jgi:predicted DCC family thiol-disulfide oxidoreductase YuxK
MPDACSATTIYFDGSCPLCRAEIGHYRAQKGAEALAFVDVSNADVALGGDLDRSRAMARFHVREENGQLVSGVAAFVAVWRRLPRLQWAARLAGLPGVMPVLELAYRGFFLLRPTLAVLFRRLVHRRARSPGADGSAGGPGWHSIRPSAPALANDPQHKRQPPPDFFDRAS